MIPLFLACQPARHTIFECAFVCVIVAVHVAQDIDCVGAVVGEDKQKEIQLDKEATLQQKYGTQPQRTHKKKANPNEHCAGAVLVRVLSVVREMYAWINICNVYYRYYFEYYYMY